jgi:TRAP-type C4-dicarboxylate transport system permease small subunit
VASIIRTYDRLVTGLGLLGGVIFLVMALGIWLDVAVRNAAGGGIAWLVDVLEYAMLVATFLAAPWVLREGAHVTIDLLASALPRRLARWLDVGASGLGTIISAIIVLYSMQAVIRAYAQGSLILKTIVFPEWWPFAVVPFGMALLTVEFLRLFIRALRGLHARPRHQRERP